MDFIYFLRNICKEKHLFFKQCQEIDPVQNLEIETF